MLLFSFSGKRFVLHLHLHVLDSWELIIDQFLNQSPFLAWGCEKVAKGSCVEGFLLCS